ncbi:MAG TPA: hypothetical protein VFM63_04125 [Pyrinomonadaceae bacterium]|nr:hypothetical protein [Pyrinomonadaceae bacterium]
MRVVFLLVLFLNSALGVAAQERKGWRGLVPLQATRADVERIVGPPTSPGGQMYKPRGQFVLVEYADGPCEKGWPYGWNVEKDTVISIWVSSGKTVALADLKLDEKKYEKYRDSYLANIVHYVNSEDGVDIHVQDTATPVVKGFDYIPSATQAKLRCPDAKNRLPAGRKQADPFHKFDAYGDLKPAHERYRLDKVAQHAVQVPESIIYIIAYAGRVANSGEAESRAACAREYVMKEHRFDAERIRAIDGGYRDKREVEISVEPEDGDIPLATPNLRPSKAKIMPPTNAPCNISGANTATPK